MVRYWCPQLPVSMMWSRISNYSSISKRSAERTHFLGYPGKFHAKDEEDISQIISRRRSNHLIKASEAAIGDPITRFHTDPRFPPADLARVIKDIGAWHRIVSTDLGPARAQY